MRPRLTFALPIVLALTLVVPKLVGAQSQAVLEKAFEGREVMMLLDMPASHAGVDLYLQREPEIEFSEYARRLKTYGVALRKGDPVMITTIKVNKKNIEIHLGGGGYGTWADDNGYVSPNYVSKSRRESDLEKERRSTTDADQKRRIDRELGYLREAREREERANRREAEVLTAVKQREIASKRLDGGSRFNIWYADKRLEKWAPTPEELMLSLSKYLDFGGNGDGIPGVTRGTAGNRLRDDQTGPGGVPAGRPRDVVAAATSLRRGLATDDVHGLLGAPTRRRSSRQGDLDAVVETWETTDTLTEVTFVGGVVVKFTSSSK